MKKKLKSLCFTASILIIIGIVCIIVSLINTDLSELQKSFISGFGTSITVLSIALLIKFIIALVNPKTFRKVEIEMTDERFKEIDSKSMAISFKICLFLESLGSLYLVILNNELGINLGLLIMVQVIIYFITNVIISKKI